MRPAGGPRLGLGSAQGRLWAVTTLGLRWGILAVMGVKFRYQLAGVAFAPWFDVERMLTHRRMS